jgi:hypothetical protein
MSKNNKNTATGKNQSTPASASNGTISIEELKFIRKEILLFMGQIMSMHVWCRHVEENTDKMKNDAIIESVTKLSETLCEVVSNLADVMSADFIARYYEKLDEIMPNE